MRFFIDFVHLPVEDSYPLTTDLANTFVEGKKTISLYTTLLWDGYSIAETGHGYVFASRWRDVPGSMLDDSRRSSFRNNPKGTSSSSEEAGLA